MDQEIKSLTFSTTHERRKDHAGYAKRSPQPPISRLLSPSHLSQEKTGICVYSRRVASVSCRDGSTMSQLAALTKHNAAATRNEVVQPRRSAIHGVRDAVSAAPS